MQSFCPRERRKRKEERSGEPPARLNSRTVRSIHVTITASLKFAVRPQLIAPPPRRWSPPATRRDFSALTGRRCNTLAEG